MSELNSGWGPRLGRLIRSLHRPQLEVGEEEKFRTNRKLHPLLGNGKQSRAKMRLPFGKEIEGLLRFRMRDVVLFMTVVSMVMMVSLSSGRGRAIMAVRVCQQVRGKIIEVKTNQQ